jgi:hypothetical protein
MNRMFRGASPFHVAKHTGVAHYIVTNSHIYATSAAQSTAMVKRANYETNTTNPLLSMNEWVRG